MHGRNISTGLDNVAFWTLLLLIIWMPLPYGSNWPTASYLMSFSIYSIFMIWLTGQLVSTTHLQKTVIIAKRPLIFLGLWLAIPLLMLVPIPSSIFQNELIADHVNSVEVLGGAGRFSYPISLNVEGSFEAFIRYLSYVILMVLILVLVTTPKRLIAVVYVMLFVGILGSTIGFLDLFTSFDFIPRKLRDGHFNVNSGTFVNRNHFAVHIAMILSLAFGLIIYNSNRSKERRSFRDWVFEIMDGILGPKIILYATTIVLLSALLLTGSRGGNFALVLSVMFVSVIGVASHQGKAKLKKVAIIFSTLIIVSIFWQGADVLFERIGGSLVSFSDDRFGQWKDSVEIFKDYWLLGVGAGAYEYIFPAYKSAQLGPFYYDHVHNDYLEMLIEQGIVGFSILGVAVISIYWRLVKSLLHRRDHLARAIIFGSLTGMTAMLIHSAVDYNFYIPANAAYFFILCGLGLVATVIRSSGSASSNRSGSSPDRVGL